MTQPTVRHRRGGRQPLPGGRKTAAYVISLADEAQVEHWRRSFGLRSASEAIRSIISYATTHEAERARKADARRQRRIERQAQPSI